MSKEKKEMTKQDKVVYSVIALIAMLIFIVITAIGCAKLEKAEASVTEHGEVYWHPFSELNWGAYSDYKEDVKTRNNGFVIVRVSETSYTYIFNDALSLCYLNGSWNGSAFYVITARDAVYVNNNGQVTGADFNLSKPVGLYFKNDAGQFSSVVGSTFDYRNNIEVLSLMPHSNITYEGVKEPTYLVNAPYLEYQSVESQSNYVDGKISPIDEGYHTVNYKIMGQPMTPPDGYEVLYEYRVYLPTKDYFRQFFREDMLPTLESLDSMKSNIPKWRRNSVGSNDSKLWIFNLDRSIEAEKTNGDDVRIRLDYADIQTEIEEFNSVSLKEYYGFDDDAWGAYGKYIMAHLVVYRVDCIVFTYNTPDVYYGRNITVIFPPYLDEPIVTEYNGDYFNPEYEYDEEIDASIEQALKDAKEESDRLVQEYKDAIAKQENMLGSYDIDFNGEGLWSSFRGLAQGVLGIGSSLSGIAVAFGSVFSFFPADVRGLVGYTFIALCVVAIWKALKS